MFLSNQGDFNNLSILQQFDDEARRIRTSAATLLREIHTPVFRRARSVTPFPVTRYNLIYFIAGGILKVSIKSF